MNKLKPSKDGRGHSLDLVNGVWRLLIHYDKATLFGGFAGTHKQIVYTIQQYRAYDPNREDGWIDYETVGPKQIYKRIEEVCGLGALMNFNNWLASTNEPDNKKRK